MTRDSLRSKLAKEFRAAQVEAGIAEPVIGISGALLLWNLCAAVMPLMTIQDGRKRRQPPIGMGALVKEKLAQFNQVLQAYEVTTKGVRLDAVMVAKGLIKLAQEMDRRITSFGGEGTV